MGRVTDIDYGAGVVHFGYAYEANENNIDTKTFYHRTGTPSPANDYDYDDLDRLTDVEYLSNQLDVEGFVMDNLGNRTGNQTLRSDGTVNFTVQSSTNRYTSIGGHSITHDDAGNLTVDKDGYQYTYDYENRVVKIENSGEVTVALYDYDALGRRIREKKDFVDSVPSVVTLFYYNPDWQVLAEYDGSNGLQRHFVYGNYIDEPLVMHRQSDGEDYYYGHDHLYSTVVLLDDGGNVVERYEYDAYGTVLVYTDDGNDDTWFTGDDTTASASALGNPYTFTGRRLDVLDDGALIRMHYRHRDYDTYAGRFMQHDPLGIDLGVRLIDQPNVLEQYHDGIGLYEYVGSVPSGFLDPLGKAWWDPRTWWPRDRANSKPDPTRDPFCWGFGTSGCVIVDPPTLPPSVGPEPGSGYRRIVPPSMGNCYRFACNDPVKPGEDHSPYMECNKDRYTCSSLRKSAKKDGLTDPQPDGSCKEGQTKVAFAVGGGLFPGLPTNDYHWWRQEPDGQWCDKPGYGLINCTSTDPINQDRTAPNGYKYDTFCGYMCAPENINVDLW